MSEAIATAQARHSVQESDAFAIGAAVWAVRGRSEAQLAAIQKLAAAKTTSPRVARILGLLTNNYDPRGKWLNSPADMRDLIDFSRFGDAGALMARGVIAEHLVGVMRDNSINQLPGVWQGVRTTINQAFELIRDPSQNPETTRLGRLLLAQGAKDADEIINFPDMYYTWLLPKQSAGTPAPQ